MTTGATEPQDPPIACTLDASAMPGRLEDWHSMVAFVRGREQIDGGLRLDLDEAIPIDDLARLVRAEQQCCAFFSFAITVDQRGVALEVRAPEDAAPIIESLFEG